MRLYLDSSVILRVLFREPERLASWDTYTSGFTSALTRIECLRTIDRLRVQGLDEAAAEAISSQADKTLERLSILAFSDDVLRVASQPFPTAVGTLDALHLASALLIKMSQPNLEFATHDRQLGVAARAMGLTVHGT